MKNTPVTSAIFLCELTWTPFFLTVPYGESYRIPTHYTHEQLASMIGCKRVAVTRAFRRLEEGEAVELKDRRIVVKDIDALKDLAEAG
jgi:DNA-binding transcriptional regulator YhcF (GntR family)